MSKTRAIDTSKWIASLVAHHQCAAQRGEWEGNGLDPYFNSCRFENPFGGIVTIFTRDVDYHTSDWWKNPDFERCLHLLVSFFDPLSGMSLPADRAISSELVNGFFGRDKRWVWVEPPYSPDGKLRGVMHYRLFCDTGWNPIKPRGEIYSREPTEAGWHSFSDAREASARTGRNPNKLEADSK